VPDRVVRFTDEFFRELDLLLSDDRTDDGAPSRIDFLLYDLPRLRDQLAKDFEGSTLPAVGSEPMRVLVTSGLLVARVALYAQLAADAGVIEVLGVDLDMWPPPDAVD
jgi:hypothetical protein